MIIKAQGDVFQYSNQTTVFSHNLLGKLFSKQVGQALFKAGRDVLVKRARIIVVGLRGPRRPSDTTNYTYLKFTSTTNPTKLAEASLVELDEWSDVNQIIGADSLNQDWQIGFEAVPVPQDIYIDNVNTLPVYDNVDCYVEIQLEVVGVSL